MKPEGPYRSDWTATPIFIVEFPFGGVPQIMTVSEGEQPLNGTPHASLREAREWLAENGYRLEDGKPYVVGYTCLLREEADIEGYYTDESYDMVEKNRATILHYQEALDIAQQCDCDEYFPHIIPLPEDTLTEVQKAEIQKNHQIGLK